MNVWWSLVIASGSLLMTWLAGEKRPIAWLVGVIVNVMWIVYALLSGQWPFAVSSSVFTVMCWCNYVKWTRPTPSVEPEAPEEPCTYASEAA